MFLEKIKGEELEEYHLIRLYVLDSIYILLHPEDNERLLDIIKSDDKIYNNISMKQEQIDKILDRIRKIIHIREYDIMKLRDLLQGKLVYDLDWMKYQVDKYLYNVHDVLLDLDNKHIHILDHYIDDTSEGLYIKYEI